MNEESVPAEEVGSEMDGLRLIYMCNNEVIISCFGASSKR